MADEYTDGLNRIYDKIDDANKQTKALIESEVGKIMTYVRENNGLMRAEISEVRRAQVKFQEKQEMHSNQIAVNKREAERMATEKGAQAGAVRAGVVSFIVSFLMLVLSLLIGKGV